MFSYRSENNFMIFVLCFFWMLSQSGLWTGVIYSNMEGIEYTQLNIQQGLWNDIYLFEIAVYEKVTPIMMGKTKERKQQYRVT